MKHRSALTLNNAWQVLGQHLTAAAAAWLQRTNAAFADCTGVEVSNLFLLRLVAAALLLGATLLVPADAAGWGVLCLLEGARLMGGCVMEFVRKGGVAE